MEYIKVKPMVYSKVHTKYIKYVYHKIFHSLQIKNQINTLKITSKKDKQVLKTKKNKTH
jgi:hypothetical protein